MITIYGYVPAFGVPDISPYVTKVINYMTFTGLEYQHKSQDLATLDKDSPTGKLPYIVDSDGTKIADSNTIVAYFKNRYGDKLDADLSKPEAANNLAWNRLIEEHLYWSGIIEPRWRLDEGWETYIPYIVQGADVSPELRAALDAFRQRILDEFNGQGMGRRTSGSCRTSSAPTSTRFRTISAPSRTSPATGSARWTRPSTRLSGISRCSHTPGRARVTCRPSRT